MPVDRAEPTDRIAEGGAGRQLIRPSTGNENGRIGARFFSLQRRDAGGSRRTH